MTPDPAGHVVAILRAAGCVFAEDEARLLVDAAASPDELQAMVARRASGVPLEHVLGWAEFAGLRIVVEPGVFVPRRRSELLVREAVRLLRDRAPSPVVVDLCCGAGGVGAAILASTPDAEMYAADIDPVAVACARRNLLPPAQVLHGDLYAALPPALRGGVDVIAANAPYVPSDAVALMPAEAREHEPRVALDGGADGLDVQRRIAAGAIEWLRPGGWLLIETSERQRPTTVAILETAGLATRVAIDEELAAVVVIGTA